MSPSTPPPLYVVAPCLYIGGPRDGHHYTAEGVVRHALLTDLAIKAEHPAARWFKGFLLSDGRAVGRYDAARVACQAKQIDWDPAETGQALFSDDLWNEDGTRRWEARS